VGDFLIVPVESSRKRCFHEFCYSNLIKSLVLGDSIAKGASLVYAGNYVKRIVILKVFEQF